MWMKRFSESAPENGKVFLINTQCRQICRARAARAVPATVLMLHQWGLWLRKDISKLLIFQMVGCGLWSNLNISIIKHMMLNYKSTYLFNLIPNFIRACFLSLWPSWGFVTEISHLEPSSSWTTCETKKVWESQISQSHVQAIENRT